MVRFLGLIFLLPFILANSHCEPMYRLLGVESPADFTSETEIQPVESPLDETPFLKIEDEGAPADPFVTCEVNNFSQYIGKSYSVFKDSIDIEKNFRVIYPNRMITYDYQASRVNLVLNDKGELDRIYCG